MKRINLIAAMLVSAVVSVGCSKETPVVASPDGSIVFSVAAEDGVPTYTVTKDGETVITPSKLGFQTNELGSLQDGLKIANVEKYSEDETWETVWGEQQYIRDNHNGMKVTLRNSQGKSLIVNVRVFDNGFGFRYEFPDDLGNFDIMDEATEFNFPAADSLWWMSRSVDYYEAYGEHTPISDVDVAYTPVVVTGEDGRYFAIHEAALTDFAKMNLVPQGTRSLKADLVPWSDGTKVHVTATRVSPWRTMTIGDKPGDLVESRIMLNLNEPSKIEDTSWIKPGKYIGIWWILHKYLYTWAYGPEHGATTERTEQYIDFAASHNIQGVLVEGWNVGWNGDWTHNTDSIDFVHAYPDYDFDAVMAYARDKGVQMIIHNETGANTVNYMNQIDEAYSKYQAAGMHYVKTGNVNHLMDGIEEHDGQYGVNRLRMIVEKAAQYQICIDEHEPVIPTGVERTWPNLMTHEAVRGQEHDAWEHDGGNRPEHTTIVPFLRGLAGPSDYTFGTFDFSNPVSPFSRCKSTIAKQLAQYVVIYSPLQMASDDWTAYDGVKAFDFISDVPTDWAETHVIDAVIGDYDITARKDRNSENWYVGAITDENARDLKLSLSFLGEGNYLAQIYADGPDASWEENPTSVAYSEQDVTASDTLDLHLATSGGCAIRFVHM